MQTIPASQKALKDMTKEDLQELADEIYSKHNGEIHSLTPSEHEQLKRYATEYYQLTGEPLQPSFHPHNII